MSIPKPVRSIGGYIPEEQGKAWVKAYVKQNPDSLKANLFGRELLEEMLSDQSVEGLWFYRALDEKGNEQLLIYKADSEGNIIYNSQKEDGGDGPGEISSACPPHCPDNGPEQ